MSKKTIQERLTFTLNYIKNFMYLLIIRHCLALSSELFVRQHFVKNQAQQNLYKGYNK